MIKPKVFKPEQFRRVKNILAPLKILLICETETLILSSFLAYVTFHGQAYPNLLFFL